MTIRKPALLLLVLVSCALPAAAQADSFGFGPPVWVDKTLGGGEPTAAYATKSGLLVYTSHEGTTHLFTSGLVGAPAESGGFISGYRNQVNIWTSADNGKTWKLVPFGSSTDPFATGFSDPDLTEDANHNIYNTGIDLANDALFSSQDGGKTWLTGTFNCHEGDRPWLAGGGNNEVWLSTDLQESGHAVFHSTDAGASCSSNSIPDFGGTPNGGSYTGDGKLYYDRIRGQLVEPVIYKDSNNRVNGIGVGILASPSAAFSNPAAKFTQVEAATPTTLYSHWPAMAIDSAGNYYLVWDTDPRDTKTANGCPGTYAGSESNGSLPPVNAPTPLANQVMMSYSTDGGHTWSPPRAVGSAPSRLLWPWVTAGSPGRVAVVWYQFNTLVDPDCAPSSAKVSVMAAELSAADTPNPTESVVDAAGRPIHSGSVCAGGTACAASNVITAEDRRLGDYFTVGTDGHGCVIIATGDTTLLDAVTGGESPISHPLFLHQDSGPGLTGQPCGAASSTTTSTGSSKGKHKKRQVRHRRAHRRPKPRPPKHQRGFTGRAKST